MPSLQFSRKLWLRHSKDPALIKRFADITTDPTPEKATPEALRKTLQSEIDRWGPMIKATGQFAD